MSANPSKRRFNQPDAPGRSINKGMTEQDICRHKALHRDYFGGVHDEHANGPCHQIESRWDDSLSSPAEVLETPYQKYHPNQTKGIFERWQEEQASRGNTFSGPRVELETFVNQQQQELEEHAAKTGETKSGWRWYLPQMPKWMRSQPKYGLHPDCYPNKGPQGYYTEEEIGLRRHGHNAGVLLCGIDDGASESTLLNNAPDERPIVCPSKQHRCPSPYNYPHNQLASVQGLTSFPPLLDEQPRGSTDARTRSNALYNYAPLLGQKESLFAGSFFPDWGYNCIGKLWNDAAEEAHWPPFAEAAVKYILETYPKPWTDHSKALIAFLFGTVSHSLGDMSWHALHGLDAGFIKALAETSFEGDYSKGHTLADIGAEFVLSHMSNMDHLLTAWKVPVRDIVAIYKQMGYNVPGIVLSHCMRNGFTGAQANARLGSQLFPVYASKSPFLVEQVEDYPMGGLRDMAAWTVECWHGLAEYLDRERELPDDQSTNKTTFNMCYALWEGRTKDGYNGEHTREGQVRRQHRHRNTDTSSALLRLSRAGLQVKSEADDDSGTVTFFIEESRKEKQEEPVETSSQDKVINDSKEQDGNDAEPFTHLFQPFLDQVPLFSTAKTATISKSTSRRSERKLEQVRFKSTANGPGVCLSFSGDLGSKAVTLFLPLEYASFGHAAVMGDFDGDGKMELAISAPHATYHSMVPSQGSVFIVPGQALFSKMKNGDENGTDVRSVASRTLFGDPAEPQSRFGWSLAIVDMNQDGIDDLAIGAPGRGAKELKYDGSVFVYFGHAGTGLSEKPDLVIYHDREKDVEQALPTGMGTMVGVGYALRGLDLSGSGFKDLVLGMPMASTTAIKHDIENQDKQTRPRTTFKQQAGKVQVFLSDSAHRGQKLDTDRDWGLDGEDAFGWFGGSFAAISQTYPQVSPSWPSSIMSSALSSLRHLPWVKQQQEDEVARHILVVGSPTYGPREEEAMQGKIQGFVIPTLPLPSPSTQPAPEKIFTIHGDSKFQQIGSRLATIHLPTQPISHYSINTRSYFSRAPTVSTVLTQQLLVLGSRSEDILISLPRVGRHWQAGMVRILDVSLLPDGTDVKIPDLHNLEPGIVRDSLSGSQSMAHLSAAMEVSTDGKSLWLAEPYAKREAGRILEWEPNFDQQEQVQKGSWKKKVFGVRGRRLVQEDYSEYQREVGDGDGDDDQDQIRQCFVGADIRSRFGSQLLVVDLNRDGKDDIVVTSSHASQHASMAGTVTIKLS
ncbi:Glycosylphosphatidylinositol specific phospholipase D1 [Mortierella polycephala]|uniref:Phosphatidylinositol-glycan-specific phospholipase D n=1 Tax=Mortierella polycephala TaxID=41804 RepID=A0A9P6Q2N5_9FUNG|nr:Glycosylphosphatidylinositol specific phospholipase D1 [Mortierella polycephala]